MIADILRVQEGQPKQRWTPAHINAKHSAAIIDPGWLPYLGKRQLRVYNALGCFVDNYRGYCWPGKGALSKITGLSEGRVRATLRELEQLGVILTEHRKAGDGGDMTSRYWLQPAPLGEAWMGEATSALRETYETALGAEANSVPQTTQDNYQT